MRGGFPRGGPGGADERVSAVNPWAATPVQRKFTSATVAVSLLRFALIAELACGWFRGLLIEATRRPVRAVPAEVPLVVTNSLAVRHDCSSSFAGRVCAHVRRREAESARALLAHIRHAAPVSVGGRQRPNTTSVVLRSARACVPTRCCTAAAKLGTAPLPLTAFEDDLRARLAAAEPAAQQQSLEREINRIEANQRIEPSCRPE